MGVYEKIAELCKAKGMSIRQLQQAVGLPNGVIGRWRESSPNSDSISKVADYFGVSVDWLLGRTEEGYYLDPIAVQLTEELKNRPEMQVLFDASRDVSSEDINFIIELINKMKRY